MRDVQPNSIESLIELDRLSGAVYLLRDLIQERLGLAFNDDNRIRLIVSRLADRMNHNHCGSVLEYYHLLMSGGAASDHEWRHIAALLAKPKSGFWRHARAVRTLVDVALPQLLSISPEGPLRIWSTSCSTGEEPLAIAMAIEEAGWFQRVPIEIHASDANYVAIDLAKQGVYGEQRISQLDVQLRDKYFIRDQTGWRVAPKLHTLIRWRVANMMVEEEVGDLARSHVIFCQNVFIYFSGHSICKTLRLFARCMPSGAYLFSGSGDYFTSLISSSGLFEPLGADASDVWIRA